MTHFDKLCWYLVRAAASAPAHETRRRAPIFNAGMHETRAGLSPAAAVVNPRVTYAVSDRILAAVMPGPERPVEVREFARPDLPAGSALLRTARSEVCGTDVHLWHGRLSGVPYPIIPGHVSAGTLEAIRGPLRGLDGAILREGDRAVFFDVHRTCGRCRACTVHRTPTRCPARRVYGITDSAADGLFGGWSQAIYLEPGVGLARLPDARRRSTTTSAAAAGC